MAETPWEMSDRTIVRQVDKQLSHSTIEPPQFEKVKLGEPLHLQAHVRIEKMPGNEYLKKASIFTNVPNVGVWEIISDEGKAFGGNMSAPSPLMYFAAGLGFCFMTHVEFISKQMGIKIDNVVLEQRSIFETNFDFGLTKMHPSDVYGLCSDNVMNLLVTSSEPPEKLKDFIEYCEDACMALQTLIRPSPAATALYLNGTRIAEVCRNNAKEQAAAK